LQAGTRTRLTIAATWRRTVTIMALFDFLK